MFPEPRPRRSDVNAVVLILSILDHWENRITRFERQRNLSAPFAHLPVIVAYLLTHHHHARTSQKWP